MLLLLWMTGLGAMVAQDKKPPSTLVLQAKNGPVTFSHPAHLKREKNDCSVCHPAIWPQDTKAPLNYRVNLHRTAETEKTSCGTCHRPGGKAFESRGNCTTKCHVKSALKNG